MILVICWVCYVRITQTVINGVRLESVQLKETVFDGHVADKMERFHGPHGTDPVQFLRQVPWLRSVANGKKKRWTEKDESKVHSCCSTANYRGREMNKTDNMLPGVAVMSSGKFRGISNCITFTLKKRVIKWPVNEAPLIEKMAE